MPVRSQNSHRMHQTSHGSPPVCGWGKPPPEPAAQSAERSAATIQSISLTQPKRFRNPTSFVLALIRMPSVWVSASIVIPFGVYIHEPTVSFGVIIHVVCVDVVADVGPKSQPHLCGPA